MPLGLSLIGLRQVVGMAQSGAVSREVEANAEPWCEAGRAALNVRTSNDTPTRQR